MVCSGKSIECKPTAFGPVALPMAPPPKLNCIFPAPQGQLLIPTSPYSPQHLPLYSNAHFTLKCLVTKWKGPLSILPWPPLWPSTSSFYISIVFRIYSLCLHLTLVPHWPTKLRITCHPCPPLHPYKTPLPIRQISSLCLPETQSFFFSDCSSEYLFSSLPEYSDLLPALVHERKGPLLY